MRVTLKRGLSIRLDGEPEQRVLDRIAPRRVAVQPADFRGLVPRLAVAAGDSVARGQALLHDRANPEITVTSPVSGRVSAIDRGARRRIEQIVISAEGDRETTFPVAARRDADAMDAGELRKLLLACGLWGALRTRPFDRVPPPGLKPRALLVTAIDTHPLAADPAVVLRERREEFATGVRALAQLASGDSYVCVAADAPIDVPESRRIRRIEFAGPHPAGLPGTHLHAVGLTVTREPDLWHIGYQDVTAIGRLLLKGRLDGERVIAIGGPGVSQPGLRRVTLGCELDALLPGGRPSGTRVISGSPLAGVAGRRFLGRHDLQVSVFPPGEGVPASGGLWRNAANRLLGRAGSGPRGPGMLPVEAFENVWPYRNPPVALLRALLIGDPDDAARLGCLGLGEDDLALCNLVCPSGIDYAAALTTTLARIEEQR